MWQFIEYMYHWKVSLVPGVIMFVGQTMVVRLSKTYQTQSYLWMNHAEIISQGHLQYPWGRNMALANVACSVWLNIHLPDWQRYVFVWTLIKLMFACSVHELTVAWWRHQSGRSPKVVALFLLQTLVAKWYHFFNCMIHQNEIKSYRNQL